ncbi:MAG: hypothetical protein LBF69_05280 [Prevotellaceae bacterium]|jgi:hypothetical protein|nr:hypothetical protein [Prevotellaceae bacterium]
MEKTTSDQPELDKAEHLYIVAECDGRDISIFLTRKEAALLRDFIEIVLEGTE